MKECLITTIIPIYNAESYLGQSIESVISQTLKFTDFIKIILVDDGSTDGSDEICRRYTREYPDNITYIKQKNSGVSAARNNGIAHAKGEYIHFLDADDILSKDYYQKSVEFLAENNQVDFVASKLMFFDASIDSHPLNRKFKQTRVINIDTSPDNPILHVISCVFRRESILDLRFDEHLKIAEDAKFLSEVILRKRAYGVLSNVTYFYRKRTDESSAIGGKLKNRDYYLVTPKRAYADMVDKWRTDSGILHPFMQYTLLYDLSYRLSQKNQPVLSRNEEYDYKEAIKNIINSLQDDIIKSTSYLDVYTKSYLLSVKGSKEVALSATNPLFTIDFITRVDGSTVKIEGYIEGLSHLGEVEFLLDNKPIEFIRASRQKREISFLGDTVYDGGAVELIIDLDVKQEHVLMVHFSGKPIRMKANQFTQLNNLFGAYRFDDQLIVKKKSYSINFRPYTRVGHFVAEALHLFGILSDWKLREVTRRLNILRQRNLKQLSLKSKVAELLKPFFFSIESIINIPRAFAFRISYYVSRHLQRRPLWIISDRGMAAGDNGEALFKYILSRTDADVDVYFALSRKSPDYQRLKDIGPVLDYGSLRYKFKFILADKIISSHADVEVTNPYLRQVDHYVNLYKFKFVFLQHGIIRNDLSGWLNRFEKNINMFITSAQREYDSLLQYPYGYTADNLLLSGMPRYDYLTNEPQRKIIIAPTYRMNLLRLKTDKLGVRLYDNQFKDSGYCRFYNSLINDERILKAMKKNNISGEVYIHPNFVSQLPDFKGNGYFQIMQYPYNYSDAMSHGSLLVSDFSSLMFDFAYLKKPVIYSQFDIDTFFEGHSYDQGDFFSDKEDGFGVVAYDYESLVEAILTSIKRDFKLESKYKQRSDTFFAYNDKQASQRVYEALML